MAILKNPALFSKVFSISPQTLAGEGIFDPVLNCDSKLFIDPLLLRASKNKVIAGEGASDFEDYFADIVKLLANTKREGDVPWRSAEKLLKVREPRGTCLGYGNQTTHGTGIGPAYRATLLQTATEIINLGVTDPELFALMGLLEAGIGADRVSDLTTRAIMPSLYKLNEQLVKKWKLKPTQTRSFRLKDKVYTLAFNPYETEESTPVILVPRDILRKLPIANDWGEVGDAAAANQELRDRVNQYVGSIWERRRKTEEEKKKLRAAALSSRSAFEAILDAVKAVKKAPYDPIADAEGYYLWRTILDSIAIDFPFEIKKPKQKSLKELEIVTKTIIDRYRWLIEKNGLWRSLYTDEGKARHEHASQLLFFAVADAYCQANDLDISPECDSGGGPVDFKFSSGYEARVVVELKLSTGKVVHGYKTQLQIYKDAEHTQSGFLVVIDIGGMGKKIEVITDIRNKRILAKERASVIEVVDGTRKESASKRKDHKK